VPAASWYRRCCPRRRWSARNKSSDADLSSRDTIAPGCDSSQSRWIGDSSRSGIAIADSGRVQSSTKPPSCELALMAENAWKLRIVFERVKMPAFVTRIEAFLRSARNASLRASRIRAVRRFDQMTDAHAPIQNPPNTSTASKLPPRGETMPAATPRNPPSSATTTPVAMTPPPAAGPALCFCRRTMIRS
jgi:hypothetical protein